MNMKRWRIGIGYFILAIVLFVTSAFVFGTLEESASLPMETAAIDQTAKNKEKENEKPKAVINTPQTEEERMRLELALVGIKTAEKSSQTLPIKNTMITYEMNPLESNESNNVKPEVTKTMNDFPSPVQGVLIRKSGNYYSDSLQAYLFHAGRDYAQLEGAVIRVKHSGRVVYAGPDPILGQKVEIDCGEDWSVIYGGLENLRVQEGDVVEVNQAIGQIGYFPYADGVKDQPQLHYEVWHGNNVQVPWDGGTGPLSQLQ